MLISVHADSKTVWLTDEPQTAKRLAIDAPVIGITGPEPKYELWSGVLYLAESFDAVTDDYCRRAACRFYQTELVLLSGDGFCLREMKEKDLCGLAHLYEDPDATAYLKHPLFSCEQTMDSTPSTDLHTKWHDWFLAYKQHVYALEEPAMWVIADEHDCFYGRLGLEWRKEGDIEGYFLGYALLKEKRGQGLVTKAALALLQQLEEWWDIKEVWIICDKKNQASAACAKRLGFIETSDTVKKDQLLFWKSVCN